MQAADGAKDLAAVGVALPGLVKNGVVEESPNLPQLKGARIEELLAAQLRSNGIDAPVTVVERCRRDGRGAGFGAWEAGQYDPGVDAWGGDWVWTLSVCSGRVGGWPYGSFAG